MKTEKTDVVVSNKGSQDYRELAIVDSGIIGNMKLNQVHKFRYLRIAMGDRGGSEKSERKRYQIKDTLFNVGWHNTETLAQ